MNGMRAFSYKLSDITRQRKGNGIEMITLIFKLGNAIMKKVANRIRLEEEVKKHYMNNRGAARARACV